ncbi:MAG: hypothetical protein RBT49_13790 [Bacteroidales bacterium]|jgi:hypothetical protein|nr:hypothetical protein [Bacteroidales bacterium]
MKRLHFLPLVILLFVTLFAHAQKPERINFDGYIRNQPRLYLPNDPYSVKYDISDWFRDQMNKDSLKLDLKGFAEGNGYTITFISDDLIVAKDAKEEREMGTNKIIYKALVEARSYTKVQIITKDNEIAYEISIKPNLFHAKEEGLGTKPTKEEALKDAEAIAKRNGDKIKRAYVREIIREYQDTLDAFFGKFNRKQKFPIFTIKPKDFNYDDFNGAAAKFQAACATSEINTTEISEAIEMWEKCALEYMPGKKTRISDVNIDELYLNLTQAYLVKEDYENAKKYWDKCTEFKGNRMVEGIVQKFYDQQLEHIAYYPVSEKNYAPKPIVAEVFTGEIIDKAAIQEFRKARSRALIFDLFIGYYLTDLHGEINMIQNYFPTNISNLKYMDANHYINKSIEEVLSLSYKNGKPNEGTFILYEDKKTIETQLLRFLYDGDQFVSLLEDGIGVINIVWNGDNVKEIHFVKNRENKTIYKMFYKSETELKIVATIIKSNNSKPNNFLYYATFNEKGNLASYSLGFYDVKKLLYDDQGIWNGISDAKEDGTTSTKFTLNFNISTDNYGNLINLHTPDRNYIVSRSYKYIE